MTAATTPDRPKYVNNRDLLAEIAASKSTFCWFKDPVRHARFDAIVQRVADITPEVIAVARAKRASFLSTKGNPVLPAAVPDDVLVFRVMTSEHIPEDPTRKRRGGGSGPGVAKTTFPPFKHYALRAGAPVEVGRSHWSGGAPPEGAFCADHGKMTRRLAEMLMLLVDRYGLRANWRGYCVDEATEALTQRGWLRGDEITTADTILSCDGERLVWSPVRDVFRDRYDGPMFHLTVAGLDALVTPGHKFLTDEGLLCPVELLREKDRLLLMADPAPDPEGGKTHADAFVELVGWAATEGCFHLREDGATERLTIYQNEGPKADRIRRSLNALGARFHESARQRRRATKPYVSFDVDSDTARRVRVILGPDKSLTMPFLLSLSQRQRVLLIEAMVDGNGFRHAPGLMRYVQKSAVHTDAFEVLCTLAGRRLTTKERAIVSFGKPTTVRQVTLFGPRNAKWSSVENIDMHGAKRRGARKGAGKIAHPNEPTVPYQGEVWCPATDFGTFVARRNGTIFVTSNTYVDEMKAHALLQLSQIALQFDESKSENPFAFYTTSIRNCLAGDTVILTREHGAVPIETIVGQEVHLLDGNGEWVLCPILDYGVQETQELVFQGGYEAVRIRSTLKHGWITPGNERLLTEDFLGQHRAVADLRPKKTVTDMDAHRRGVVHGLVYGDGSEHAVRSFIIHLCGAKASLGTWLEGHDRAGWEEPGGDPIFIVRDPWADLKALPEKPGEDPDYLLGFLRGWMAADGCVSKSTNATLCGDRAEYEWVSRWGPLVGWHTRGFSAPAALTDFGERKNASGNMRLKKHSLCADDFLNPEHRERRGEIDPPAVVWRTYSHKQDITKRRVERVYCPYVPTTNSMALGSGIHSAQCFTRVLNLEKRAQHIRDDLLIMAGARPSYARQIKDEEMQRAQAAVGERAMAAAEGGEGA